MRRSRPVAAMARRCTLAKGSGTFTNPLGGFPNAANRIIRFHRTVRMNLAPSVLMSGPGGGESTERCVDAPSEGVGSERAANPMVRDIFPTTTPLLP